MCYLQQPPGTHRLDLAGVNDQFPSRIEAGLWRLALPEGDVERPVEVGQFDATIYESFAHRSLSMLDLFRRGWM